jgi:hypothetical protein
MGSGFEPEESSHTCLSLNLTNVTPDSTTWRFSGRPTHGWPLQAAAEAGYRPRGPACISRSVPGWPSTAADYHVH